MNGVNVEYFYAKAGLSDAVAARGVLARHVQHETAPAIIGESESIDLLRKRISIAAGEDITVLVCGESGTGKELVAQAIHRMSKRSDGPFIPLNMGAFTAHMIPSELFGHERGAFTGATEKSDGIFLSAENGTLFLDEIGSMDFSAQSSLLRILEDGTFRHIGGNRQHITHVRIIAASNMNLYQAVEEHVFRRDLLHRLEVFTIDVPPLRERAEDIPLLVDYFIHMFNKQLAKPDIVSVTRETIDCFMNYSWPGNVRELKNCILRAMLLADSNVLDVCWPSSPMDHESYREYVRFNSGLPLEEIEKRYIEHTLFFAGGNKSAAAKMLGVSRRYLYNKITQYNLLST